MTCMPNSPRILHVVWNLIRGGTEGQCARVALGLGAQGVLARVAVSRREGFFLGAVEQACGPVYHMDIHRRYGWHTWRELRRLDDFLRAERFDALHAWDADAAIFGSIAAQRAGVPLITSRRDLGEIYAPRKLRRMEQADGQAVAVVVNADAIGARVRVQGVAADRVHLIPNILDLDEFDRLAVRPFGLEEQLGPGRWIGHVARLDPEKDVATLLRAAARVVAEVPAARFALAGDGVERARLEALAAELHLGQHVVFLGDVTEVPALLRRMELAVLCPRANEGLSNSILEYQAAGLPVMATDCGGNRELVREGVNGHVVAVGDHDELADRLIGLLLDTDRARAMGQSGRWQVEQHHRPEAVCRQFADLYRRVLSG